MSEKVLIAIPTFNESENLAYIVEQVFYYAPEVEVLVVDDNSPDGTGRIAQNLGQVDSRVHVLERKAKAGLGPAYLAAFEWAISRGFTWVGEFDADGSHRPQDLPRLLYLARGLSKPDLVIGSRWVRGGLTRGWSRKRELLSRAGNLYVNLVLGLGVRDATAGFRVYRVDFLEKMLSAVTIESRGYGFQVEMTWRTKRLGGVIREVPVTFVERRAGVSKMSGSIVKEAFVEVLRWRRQELFGR